MRLGKELLRSFIVMMHFSFMASRPVPIQDLWDNMQALELPLCNLKQAENDYIKHIFKTSPPVEYKTNSLKPLEGITIPVGNTTEEIQDSVCAISNYFTNNLPHIIRNLTVKHRDELIGNTTVFYDHFKEAVKMWRRGKNEAAAPKRCHRNYITTTDVYTMKEIGLRIIYIARKWVEKFANIEAFCNL